MTEMIKCLPSYSFNQTSSAFYVFLFFAALSPAHSELSLSPDAFDITLLFAPLFALNIVAAVQSFFA